MRRAINTSVRLFAETFRPAGPVIEIGSYYLPGYQDLCDLRPYFPGTRFIGCDLRPGPGVDVIEDAQELSFPDAAVGVVLLCEVLEHLPYPERAVAEARRVLRPDGLLALSAPFAYRVHGFPRDYWRFTSHGIWRLLDDFPDKIVFALGPRLKPAFVFAAASRMASREFTAGKAEFQARVTEAFRRTRLRGYASALKERGRDFFGCLTGRAELSVAFFDPAPKRRPVDPP